MNAIEITGFMKRYRGGTVAVENLDLTVPCGSFFGFVGPNGAGKSTTVNYIAGLIRESRGALRLFGETIERGSFEHKRRMGIVLERPSYLDRLIGREYLHFVGRMYGLAAAQSAERTNELLSLLDIDDSRDRQIRTWSAGMKKKVSLAAALIHDPDLLLLDEPFEGIDAVSAKTIRAILGRVVERGGTIFLTSHMLHIVEVLCDEVAIIHQGRIVFVAPSGKIRETFRDERMTERCRDLEDLFMNIVGVKETDLPSWLD